MRKLCTAALLAAAAASAPAAAQDTIRIEHEQFRLPNGLTVILHRDSTTPTVATNIWYHVGSSHEAPGRTGLAHLFEHIMFEGSKNVPEGAIDEWLEEVGGSPNGSTTRDRTNYMQTFSSNALELVLFVESDRMAHLLPAMTAVTVDGQRDVVKNERRQGLDNRPYGLAAQLLPETLYPAAHPYSWPIIGYMDHLSAASYEDVVAFFRQYYTPNNATLAIAGDIDIAETRRLVTKWFADVPPGPVLRPLAVRPPVVDAPRRVVLEDRVQLPRIYMSWVSPAAFQDGDAEMTAVARLLTGGKNSRLYQRLVYELQIADDVAASQDGGRLAGDFTVMATARAGHTLEELERVILQEIERVRQDEPTARELERIVNQYEVAFLERLELIDEKADLLNAYLFYAGTPDYVAQDLARFRRLTPGHLSAAARRFLDPERRAVLSIVPQSRADMAVPESSPVGGERLEMSPGARAEAAP